MGKPQKRSIELQDLARDLYKKLGSGNAVARKLGVSPPTAYRMLRDAGYGDLTSTTDSCAVCALHLEHHYDPILLDLQMPGLDVFQQNHPSFRDIYAAYTL